MSTHESLNETFDIEVVDEEKAIKAYKKKAKDLVVSNRDEDKTKDYAYARGQLYNIVDKMSEMLNGAMEVAEESSHPRSFEVALQGAKAAAEVVEKITDLHSKMDKIDDGAAQATTASQQGGVQNNIFFAGSTKELAELVKENQKQ